MYIIINQIYNVYLYVQGASFEDLHEIISTLQLVSSSVSSSYESILHI